MRSARKYGAEKNECARKISDAFPRMLRVLAAHARVHPHPARLVAESAAVMGTGRPQHFEALRARKSASCLPLHVSAERERASRPSATLARGQPAQHSRPRMLLLSAKLSAVLRKNY
jgi:hypothetical protein